VEIPLGTRIRLILLKNIGLKNTIEKDGCLVVSFTLDKRCKLTLSHSVSNRLSYDTLKVRQGEHISLRRIPVVLLYAPWRVKSQTEG
jgi:hypothetical protein